MNNITIFVSRARSCKKKCTIGFLNFYNLDQKTGFDQDKTSVFFYNSNRLPIGFLQSQKNFELQILINYHNIIPILLDH